MRSSYICQISEKKKIERLQRGNIWGYESWNFPRTNYMNDHVKKKKKVHQMPNLHLYTLWTLPLLAAIKIYFSKNYFLKKPDFL